MKPLLFALCLFSTFATLPAQKFIWQPSPGHTQTPIWPGTPPDARPAKGPESAETDPDPTHFIAGKPTTGINNVSRPTMTVYSPTGKNTGAAVVVFPGGGYEMLAIDLEGTEVCDWLVPRGITCVLLKYRVPAPRSHPYWGAYPQSPIALEDAQRTVGLVRFHAAEWHIDPHKIGVPRLLRRRPSRRSDGRPLRPHLPRRRCRRQSKLPPRFCGGNLSRPPIVR